MYSHGHCHTSITITLTIHYSEDGCAEWGAGQRFFLCGCEEIVEVDKFRTYCSAAEASPDKSCGKTPKEATVGSSKLKEPCEDCKSAGKWEETDGVWEKKEE